MEKVDIPRDRRSVQKIWEFLEEIRSKLDITKEEPNIAIPLMGGRCLKDWSETGDKFKLNNCLQERWDIVRALEKKRVISAVNYPTNKGYDGIFRFKVEQEGFWLWHREFRRANKLRSEFYELKQDKKEDNFICTDLIYDIGNQEIRFAGNAPIRLTIDSPPGRLLKLLLENKNEVLSYNEISKTLDLGYDSSVARREVSLILRDLKKKLLASGMTNDDYSDLLITRKGYGLRCY